MNPAATVTTSIRAVPIAPLLTSMSRPRWPRAAFLLDDGEPDPPPLPLPPPLLDPPPEVDGVVGVKTAAELARHAETAALTAFVSEGAFLLIVAFPAKSQDCAFLFVAS